MGLAKSTTFSSLVATLYLASRPSTMGSATATTYSSLVATLYLASPPSSMGAATSTTLSCLAATLYFTSPPSSMGDATSTTLSSLVATFYLTSLSLPHLRKGMSVTRDRRESKLLKVKKGLGTVSTVHAVLCVLGRVPVTSHYYTNKKT